MKTASTTTPATMTVDEAARLLGVGRNLAYQAVREGQLPAIRLGKRIVIPRAAVLAMLEGGHGKKDDSPS